MLLAAGKGERLRPLTLSTPKPLLMAGGKTLLAHWLDKLEPLRPSEVIINAAYLGEQIQDFCLAYRGPLKLTVILEDEPLETGGALHNALAVIGDEPFLLINADVFCEFPLALWFDRYSAGLCEGQSAHFLFVDNPEHNPNGDFGLDGQQVVLHKKNAAFTFSGLSIISPLLIKDYPHARKKFPLREVFIWAIERAVVYGEYFGGYWLDVGTEERLRALDAHLMRRKNGSL